MSMYIEFKGFCKKSGFIIDKNQDIVLNQVFENIDNECRVQIVLMPNAAGKTNLSLLLSCFFAQKEIGVLRYSPMEKVGEYDYLPHIKCNSEWMEKVEHANAGTVINYLKSEKRFGFVIADGLAYTDIASITSSEVTEKVGNLLTNSVDVNVLSQADMEWIGQRYLSKVVVKSQAKTIIFMKGNELKLCSKTTFLLSSKKRVVDIYGESKDNDNNVYVRSQNEQDILQAFVKHFDDRMDRMECKIDDIGSRVKEMHEIVNSLNLKVSKQKKVISSYADIAEDEESIEKVLESVLNRLVKQLNEEINQYERLNSFQQYRQLVMVRMGNEAWNKLSEESQRFLVTAKFTFSENMLLGDNIDYSSICLLASKAFEIELAKRFVVEYEKYLQERFGKSYNKWPSSLVKMDKYGELRPITEEEFMLGACPYIMGIFSKDKQSGRINKECFYDYCKSILMKEVATDNLEAYIAKLNKQIKTIKDKYRNPAAHKESIGMLEASECIDYILEVERILKMMLESFKF